MSSGLATTDPGLATTMSTPTPLDLGLRSRAEEEDGGLDDPRHTATALLVPAHTKTSSFSMAQSGYASGAEAHSTLTLAAQGSRGVGDETAITTEQEGMGRDTAIISSFKEGFRDVRPAGLDSALASLRDFLKSAVTENAEAIAVARQLRDAAVRIKNRNPRHAALALVLSDALAFTDMSALDQSDTSRAPLARGFQSLLNPFVSGETEQFVVEKLLEKGWSLTPPFDVEVFGSLEPDLSA